MYDALSVHALCIYLYVCMDVLFMLSSILIYSLVHSLYSANTIYAPTAHDSFMKHISVSMWLSNINADKYVWIKTYTVFVYILWNVFKTCHTLLVILLYGRSKYRQNRNVEEVLKTKKMCSWKVSRINDVSWRNKCRNHQRCLILGGIVYASLLLL